MQLTRFASLFLLAVAAWAVPGSAAIIRGQLPPDFTGTTLDGKKIKLSEFRGKNPVVLNFFAEFCPPCRKEFPHLKALDKKFGPAGLRVISVSLDADKATAAIVPKEHKVAFPVIFDPKGTIADTFNVQAIPHTVIMDRDGKVVTTLVGLDLKALDQAVAKVVK